MKQVTLPVAEVGLVALTRIMLGVGLTMLLVDQVDAKRRKAIGAPLLAIGILSTAPLIADIFRRANGAGSKG